MKKKKKKEQLHQKKQAKAVAEKGYPRGQFWFNVISLSIMILICLYIGGRSLYYYSEQHRTQKKEEHYLGVVLTQNQEIVSTGDGLYQNGKEYVFKGKEVANYVEYSNRLWRVLKVYEDHRVLLVADHNQSIMLWGDGATYQESNLYTWLNTQEEIDHSGIFYASLNQPENYLAATTWCEETMTEEDFVCQDEEKEASIALLTPKEYATALGKESFLNDGSYTWLLGSDMEGAPLYLSASGSVASATSYDGYGVKPVITIKSDINVTGGTGTKEDPYKIETEQGAVGSFVKLGDDLWRIVEQQGDLYKMSLDHYLLLNGSEVYQNYSDQTTMFDINDRYNIGYYLNHTYLNSLSYQDALSECTFYTGEMSDEAGYDYLNIYQSQVNAKVGLANLVDLKINPDLSDYFLMNMTSLLGDMAWVHYANGELHEATTSTEKHIVPIVCIHKDQLKNGTGKIDAPYVME